MLVAVERSGDCGGHLLLLRSILKITRLGQKAVGRKDFFHLFDQVQATAGAFGINNADHAFYPNVRLLSAVAPRLPGPLCFLRSYSSAKFRANSCSGK